jgi:hypothetical protein
MNETLRRAMFRARFSEEDVASRLAVDPKTVRRWIEGRVPYPRHRWALAAMLHSNEQDLWPGPAPDADSSSIPSEVVAVYAHRWAVPREVWYRLFSEARHEISILAYSSLFLAEDSGLLDILTARAEAGVTVRIALGDPDCPRVAERGTQEGIEEAMAAKIRNALALYRRLRDSGLAEIRLHRTVLYNSIYRADDDLLVNQHAYGIPATNSPVLHLQCGLGSEVFRNYAASFGRVWSGARVLSRSRPSGS